MADVLAANQGLYDAVENGDLDLMSSLWLPGESTLCIHPGAEPVRGTSAILRSWAVEFLALHDDAEGPYNLSSPDPRTNGEFTAELAAQLSRPAVVRAPALAVNATVGELGSLLLGSLRIRPMRILHTGFEFQQPELAPIIREALRP